MKKFCAVYMLLSCALCNAAPATTKAATPAPGVTTSPEKQSNISATMSKVTTPPVPTKISGAQQQNYVVVDVQDIILKTQVDKDPVNDLMKLQQNKQKELQDLGTDIQNKEKELQTKASVLSPDSLKNKQEELEEMRQKAQLKLQRANNELREAEMKTRGEVFQKVQVYAQQWADSNPHVDIVFEKNGGILAFSSRVNATTELSDLVQKDLAKKEAVKKKAAPKKDETNKPNINTAAKNK